MKIKRNDMVHILLGKDRGKTGKVLQVFPKLKRVSVEGVNILIKNLKPKKSGEKGQRINYPSPLNISNLALLCTKCGKPTRVGFKILENKKKARVCKKCKEIIE
ncbi:MAG: 50S ribosomal protein L24 [Candidatus Jacksonbacteria bacterium RIFOXYA2_FULL_44_7]|uniref:Large ribosomal subunit protein uL24 n=1 Tax=Candidatus Jacksonbacteria bacterium RIFCSPLOWO2_02_FULL_44_20 TaxID=1798460 RepID=A0A1G2ACA4_9BACT|nr:MAG: 50S ribosomal protein L24 [Parcubacteria group bacterium GW2011_GWC2_44_17]KKT49947.1 MAG: 50S ribosomal protein L24 [Parcubacteria group bacterium GW2011_GWF2_44_17]OGY70452.1 MAG: 50S ribosomal protein L24 [Candidatus Jacksonbacteria bacterium RIFCSPHIGHO2_12_FULL_44_12]OGY71550.1 MAG: 50S ribosomal protein L24 [Candidatus Jacksonbacteria bacterium RIFCSPHIGHO2_02_FULL_44_25]OGY73667.1 MAG: 50S ribosomal protein L24 [Candidatus Jacksonbacteria bacterium RIFCSPLOWO2_02_FULL_44_20]OGY7